MPLIVILPGIVLLALQAQFGGYDLPVTPDGETNYNMALPVLLENRTRAACWASVSQR